MREPKSKVLNVHDVLFKGKIKLSWNCGAGKISLGGKVSTYEPGGTFFILVFLVIEFN